MEQTPRLFIKYENFLPAAQHAAVLDFALSSEKQFAPSSVDTTESAHRSSLVHYNTSELLPAFSKSLAGVLALAEAKLGMPPRPGGQIECQLTAHNDGHFYKLHNDNGSPGTRSRTLSYIYYFHRTPKGFSGGDLRIFYSRVENGFYVAAEQSELITPTDNSVVFFQSHHLHEVLPVLCSSKAFSDSRFTLNGWIRQQAP